MEAVIDPAVARIKKRVRLFERRGMDLKQATELAERLFLRDSDFDDRRMCIECTHLQRDGACFAARQGWIAGAATFLTPVQTMLQRCERFEWQKP